MNRPPTPPTTPQAKLPEPATRLPTEVIKKLPSESLPEPEMNKSEPEISKPLLHSVELTKQKVPHLEQGKMFAEVNRLEYPDVSRSITSSPEAGKMIRQISKAQIPANLVKAHRAKGVAVVLPPNKQLYQNAKTVKVQQSQILTGAVASSPPRVVKTSPPVHELHPMTGAVASPPPRAPHLASQQPVVTGASSSRALVDTPKGPGASPRGLTIPPYEAALVSSFFFLQCCMV